MRGTVRHGKKLKGGAERRGAFLEKALKREGGGPSKRFPKNVSRLLTFNFLPNTRHAAACLLLLIFFPNTRRGAGAADRRDACSGKTRKGSRRDACLGETKGEGVTRRGAVQHVFGSDLKRDRCGTARHGGKTKGRRRAARRVFEKNKGGWHGVARYVMRKKLKSGAERRGACSGKTLRENARHVATPFRKKS